MSDNIEDKGIIVLMYHRFNENKYPSTNIKLADFVEQINLIKKNQFKFVNPNDFDNNLLNEKNTKKILITVDDGFKLLLYSPNGYEKKDELYPILFL